MTSTFELTPKQLEGRKLLGAGQAHSLLYGGSRSGKTFLMCYAIAVRAIRAAESRHAMTRLHNIDVRQAVMQDTFPKMMRLAFPDVPYQVNKTDQFVSMPNDSEVWFAGLDDKDRVEKILGKEFATIGVNESSQVSYKSVETLRTRLAQAAYLPDGTMLPLRAYYDLNPAGKSHWTYKEFHLGVKPTGEKLNDPDDFKFLVMNPTDNPHLPAEYLKQLQNLSARQKKRYFEGQYLSDVPGAFWTSAMIEAARIPKTDIETMRRIVIAIDPATTSNETSNETGIVAAAVRGTGQNAHGYVLQDLTGIYTPSEWAKVAVKAFKRWGADRFVAEGNQGGEMVKHTIQTAMPNAPVKIVHARRGKDARAEPVAALYEDGRVSHVGELRDTTGQTGLEDQMTSWVPGESDSPDRVDALVWAITDLMITGVTNRPINVIVG